LFVGLLPVDDCELLDFADFRLVAGRVRRTAFLETVQARSWQGRTHLAERAPF
jgi:hypothetical protein